MKIEGRDLSIPEIRALTVIELIASTGTDRDIQKFAELMMLPARQPTPEMIEQANDFQFHSLMYYEKQFYGMYYAFFAGLGSVTVWHDGEDKPALTWLDPLPGPGIELRLAFMEAVMEKGWPKQYPMKIMNTPNRAATAN